MELIRNENYLRLLKLCFDDFKKDFKIENQTNPDNFKYILLDIPHTELKAVDIYTNNELFIRRYIILIIKNKSTNFDPWSYWNFVEENLCDLKSHDKIASYFRGILFVFLNDKGEFLEFDYETGKIVSC